MNVLFVSQYSPVAASSRTRVFQYLPILKAQGIATHVETVIPDTLLAALSRPGLVSRLAYYARSFFRTLVVALRVCARAGRYDAIVIQKVLFPGFLTRFLRRHRDKVVFDFDDAIFTIQDPEANWLQRLQARRRAANLPRALSCAGHAIVENDYTRAYADRYCQSVTIITGPIDTERYHPKSDEGRSGLLLGWIGSPTTTQYLEVIRPALERLGRHRDGLTLRLIGAGPFGIDAVRVEHVAWALDTEVEALGVCDIGLMPLPGNPWTEGKGGYKILQYSALGLPVVASPVGINQELVLDGETGFLVEETDDWVSKLDRLLDDGCLRRRLGDAGRSYVEERYSLSSAGRQFTSLLRLLNKEPVSAG